MTSTFFMFETILVSLLLAMMFSYLSIRLATRLHLIDVPNSAPHKQHQRPTPIAGGLAMATTILITVWLFDGLKHINILSALAAGAVVFLFALWDDYRSLPAWVKLIGQVLAAVVLIRFGVYIQIFESPEFFLHSSDSVNLYLDWLITIFWIVGITNAFNFVDSMDGLAVGLGGTTAAFFMLVTLDAQQPYLSQLSALLVGTCVGLFLYNSPPARLFLGDSGAQTLGFLLAVLGIAYRPLGANQSSSWLVPIMLLGVPIFDMTLVVMSRMRRKRPVYSGNRDHTYHRLLRLGLEPFRAVVVMQIAELILGCLAFVILLQPPLIANIVFAALVLLAALLLIFLDQPEICEK